MCLQTHEPSPCLSLFVPHGYPHVLLLDSTLIFRPLFYEIQIICI